MKVFPTSRYTFTGCHPDSFRRDGHCTEVELDANLHRYKELTGSLPAFAITAAWQFDALAFRLPFELMEVMDNRGVIPLVILWPYGDGCLERINSGEFDAAFQRQAAELFTWSYGGHRPVMIQFGTEVTLASYPWSAAQNGGWELTGMVDGRAWPLGPAKYIHAHRRVHSLFAKAGCDVTWNWHTLADYTENVRNLPAWYYPGNDYTDWIGVGLYLDAAGGLWGTYEGGMRESLNQISGFVGRDKPLYVEVMCQEHPTDPTFKPNYFRDVFNRTFSGEFERATRHGGAIGYWDAYTATQEAGLTAVFRDGPQPKFTRGAALASAVPARMGIDSSPAALLAYREGVGSPWCTNKARLV